MHMFVTKIMEVYLVSSETDHDVDYLVTRVYGQRGGTESFNCNCPDYVYRKGPAEGVQTCKHIDQVVSYLDTHATTSMVVKVPHGTDVKIQRIPK